MPSDLNTACFSGPTGQYLQVEEGFYILPGDGAHVVDYIGLGATEGKEEEKDTPDTA